MPRHSAVQSLEARRLLATLAGAVYEDFDGDGRVDASEQPLAGIEVFIDANANDVLDAGEASTTTTRDGYSFTVEPGTYRVAQVARANSLRTYPGTGRMILSRGTWQYFNGLYEINPATGQVAREINDSGFAANAAVHGEFIYTYAAPAAGSPGRVFRQHFLTGESTIVTLTDLNITPTWSVVFGNELFLRYGNATASTVAVLDLATGDLRRTLSLPGGVGGTLAAMPDFKSLLVATATDLLWIDPQTAAVTRTVTRTGQGASQLPLRVAYMNGTAFLQWNTSSQYVRVDVLSGAATGVATIEGGGTLLTNESSSHVVTVEPQTQFALAMFQQGEYSQPAQPPIILSASNNFQLNSTIRVAIGGTTAGARLMLYHPTASSRDRNVFYATATEGTTILEFKGSDIARTELSGVLSTHGVEVLQTQPFKLVQPHTTATLVNYSPEYFNFSYNRPPGPGTYGWTTDTRPRFLVTPGGGNTITNAEIELYANASRVATAEYINNVVPIRPTDPLPDGRYDFTALVRPRLARPGPVIAWQDRSPLSVALEIDTVAPTAAMSYAFNTPTPAFHIAFSEPVLNAAGLVNQVVVERLDADGNVVETLPPSAFNGAFIDPQTFAMTPALGTFADGKYHLTLPVAASSTISDRAGNPLSPVSSAEVYVLAGDVDRDRSVDFSDLLLLAQNYGQTGKTFSQGNIDYSADGSVNFDDLLLLAQRYGTSLLQAPLRQSGVAKRHSLVIG